MPDGGRSVLWRTLVGLLYAACLLLAAVGGEHVPGAAAATADADSAEDSTQTAKATASAPEDTGPLPLPRSGRTASAFIADRFVDRLIDGESISYLFGNVYIDRDTLTARSDTAIIYRDRDVYEMHGNVRLRQHSGVLTCRRAVYRKVEEAGDFFGDVRIEDEGMIGTSDSGESRQAGRLLRLIDNALLVTPEYTVWADTIERDRATEIGEAFGHVKIVHAEAKALVTGDHATFSGSGDMAEVDRNPVLVSRGSGGQTLEAVSGLMRTYRGEDRAVLIDSVRITQGGMLAVADTAHVLGQDKVILRGSPQVWQGERSTMIGDEIEFYYSEGQIERINLHGSARMEDTEPDSLAQIFAGLPAMDVIEGDTVSIFFRDDEVRRAVVIGDAHSIYVPLDAKNEVAFNEVIGDTITIDFQRRRVRRVNVRGNMSGVYHFANLATMGADDLAEVDSTGIIAAALDSLATVAADSAVTEEELIDAATALATAAVDTLTELRAEALADSLVAAGTDLLSAGAADTLAAALTDSLVEAGMTPGFDFAAFADDVVYSGHEVTFDLKDKTISIAGDGKLAFDVMTLTAQEIELDTTERELYAQGDPLLTEKETVAGERMGYNFEARTGAMQNGVTSYDGSFYVGEEIIRYPDGTMKICKGRMTSCDLAKPHYHIWAGKMKMRMDDKVVAAPIVMKIGEMPVFFLPFYYKSLKSGRRSGIIFPNFNFGWSEREGRYIRDMGYYWATNDYTDFIFEFDYNERRELAWRILNQYNKRYSFTGSVLYNRRIELNSDTGAKEWQFRLQHNQPTLLDDYKFRASISLASETLSQNDLSRNTGRDVVSGQLKSTGFISRNFTFASSSLNLDRDERTNARDDDPSTNNQIYTMTLPSLTMAFQQFTLMPAASGSSRGNTFSELLRNTYFGQNYAFSHARNERELDKTRSYSANGSWKLDLRPPRIWILNLAAGTSASHRWVSVRNWGDRFDENDQLESFDAETQTTTPSVALNASAGTTLYGHFNLGLGRLEALRHTLRMNTSYSWRPHIGGKQVKSESYGFSLGNRFDMKYLGVGEDDSTLVSKKLDGLIDWSLSSSYNPDAEADSRWSNIGSTLNFRPSSHRALNFKINNTIDPYAWRIIFTQINYGFNLQGRVNTGASTEAQIDQRNASIDRLGVESTPAREDSLSRALREEAEMRSEDEFGRQFDDPFDRSTFYGDTFTGFQPGEGGDGQDPTEGGRFLPWRLGANFSYSRRSGSDQNTARGSLTFSAFVTRNWEFRYSTSFDLEKGNITTQEYGLYRDLHCWRVEFTRTINNVNAEFGFRIYLKSIPDLKLSRGREGLLGSMSSATGGMF